MNKIKNILIFLIIISAKLFSQTNDWKIVSSKISFKIKNAGLNVDGILSGLTGKINFGMQANNNSIEASIDSKTINTGNNLRDEHLRGADYFDVTKFQKITLKSTKISKEKNGTFVGTFTLTIKNKTKVITIPFTFIETGDNAVLKGNFTINRLDFEVGDSSFILSDNVTVNLEAKVSRN